MARFRIIRVNRTRVDENVARTSYVAADARDASNKKSKLKCPNPGCENSPLIREVLAEGHILFQCTSCTFGFDNLGEMAPVCPICHKKAQVFQTTTGYLISCPTGDKQAIRLEWQ